MFVRSFITGILLIVSGLLFTSCQPPVPQTEKTEPPGKHYDNPATKVFNPDQEKYNLVNIELASLNLKLVPQSTVNNSMPDMTKGVKQMPQMSDPGGMRKAFKNKLQRIPVLLWTNQPPATPIPQEVIDKAMPIVKKQFPGCLWRSVTKK